MSYFLPLASGGRPLLTSRALNCFMSSSNQIKILRLPVPAKLMLFSGFCAYFIAVERLHPHISATSLVMYIFSFAMISTLIGAGFPLPRGFCYFATRKIRRITSPVIISARPIVVKSIDFTSYMGYVLRAGPYDPASLTNLTGQSGLGLTLLWLQHRLRLQAPVAGSFYLPSYSSPPCGLSRRLDTINIQQVVFIVKRFFQKSWFF